MEVKKNEILFIYNSASIEDRRALGYATALKSYKLKEFDVQNQVLTPTQIKEIANLLHVKPHQIIDENSEIFKNKYANKSLKSSDVLKVLNNEPGLIKTPIVVYEKCAEFLMSPYQLVKSDMSEGGIRSQIGSREETSSGSR